MFCDDGIYSLVHFLSEYTGFVCKDLTGAHELVTGKLVDLFPDFAPGADGLPHVFPLRLYDLETLPTPSVGVAIEIDPTPQTQMFGANLYRHTGRFLAVATKEVRSPDGTRTLGKDYDATVNQGLQLQNALTLAFRGQPQDGEPRDTLVPWFRATYDVNATPARVGDMKIVGFRITPVDENRFLCSFQIEVIE